MSVLDLAKKYQHYLGNRVFKIQLFLELQARRRKNRKYLQGVLGRRGLNGVNFSGG